MKILWITNTIFPAPSKTIGIPAPVFGGWMYGLAMKLATSSGIKLAVATIYQGKELKSLDIERVTYYLIPSKSTIAYQKRLEPYWQTICEEFKPDIVHIHGTEFTHGLSCMRKCPTLNYVVSIQGIVGVYSRYYYAGISILNILKNITFRDVVRCDTLFQGKKNFKLNGIFENEFLQKTHHVIGRTSWDFAHTKAINPSLSYHFCNESLRDCFYNATKWNINSKTNYTIFLSQAAYPIKGLHQVLKAVALLISDFPEIKVRVAGPSIIRNNTILDKMKISGYGSYIKKIMNKYKLNDIVHFTGLLNERQMVNEYQNCHVFICPSSIENSPNSLCEAAIIGAPIIAAYVGGIPDMLVHDESGLLYQFEEIEMLSENIRRIFSDNIQSERLSQYGIKVAEQRHNADIILEQTLKIYTKVLMKDIV